MTVVYGRLPQSTAEAPCVVSDIALRLGLAVCPDTTGLIEMRSKRGAVAVCIKPPYAVADMPALQETAREVEWTFSGALPELKSRLGLEFPDTPPQYAGE